jgi:hypothetical protein
MEFLKEKEINDYSAKVKRIFNFLTIAGEYRVVGSASLKKIKYFSDYDLDELLKDYNADDNIFTKIYKSFRKKFIDAKKNPNIFITDFKCGMDSNGEPLRWSYDDMMKGYKMTDEVGGISNKVYFEDCINMKTTIKLDVVALIDGIFTEFSENYYFKFGKDEGNFFPHDIDKEHLLNELKHSYDEYMYAGKNYLKALKRIFAYKKLKNKTKYKAQLEKMFNYFNSPIGLLNKIRSELDIILVVLENENNFRTPKKKDIVYNLEVMKKKLNSENYTQFDDEIDTIIANGVKKSDLKNKIEDLRNQLYHFVNKNALDFISKNKNLLLY